MQIVVASNCHGNLPLLLLTETERLREMRRESSKIYLIGIPGIFPYAREVYELLSFSEKSSECHHFITPIKGAIELGREFRRQQVLLHLRFYFTYLPTGKDVLPKIPTSFPVTDIETTAVEFFNLEYSRSEVEKRVKNSGFLGEAIKILHHGFM